MPSGSPSDTSPSRDRILGLLRYHPRTVEQLAVNVGLTRNGIRVQLTTLERDGLVRRGGVRRLAGPGKPAQLYALTARAEMQFSAAYPPALTALVETLASRLTPGELRSHFRAVGQRIARTVSPGSGRDPVSAATHLLNGLGAAVMVHAGATGTLIEGAACPLGETVRSCPDACEMVRAYLAHGTGAQVGMRCDHGDAPRCRFSID